MTYYLVVLAQSAKLTFYRVKNWENMGCRAGGVETPKVWSMSYQPLTLVTLHENERNAHEMIYTWFVPQCI
jgi:lysozyme family protein